MCYKCNGLRRVVTCLEFLLYILTVYMYILNSSSQDTPSTEQVMSQEGECTLFLKHDESFCVKNPAANLRIRSTDFCFQNWAASAVNLLPNTRVEFSSHTARFKKALLEQTNAVK